MIAGLSPSGVTVVDIFFIFSQLSGMRWMRCVCFARQMRQRWRDGEEEVEEESS